MLYWGMCTNAVLFWHTIRTSIPSGRLPSVQPHTVQVGARIVKAGPDNATVYMTGMGIMYKEHEILVEVNNDGSGVICESLWLQVLSSYIRKPALHVQGGHSQIAWGASNASIGDSLPMLAVQFI